MKIYLDTCSLQRLLDSRTQIRISLEAEAVLGILGLCETGQVDLVSSEALNFETSRLSNLIRQEYAWEILAKAKWFVMVNEQVEQRSRELVSNGIHPLDALHLALAEEAQVDFFCTCDDKLLKRAGGVIGLRIKTVTPVELIEELEI